MTDETPIDPTTGSQPTSGGKTGEPLPDNITSPPTSPPDEPPPDERSLPGDPPPGGLRSIGDPPPGGSKTPPVDSPPDGA
jgi:hypothetical protein